MMNLERILSAVLPNTPHTEVDGRIAVTLPREAFTTHVIALVETHGLRLALLYGTDNRKTEHAFGVHAVLTNDAPNTPWLCISTALPESDPTYPSLTTHLIMSYWYERYMHDMFGIVPVGHPDLRRLVHHENIPNGTYPLRKDFVWNTKLPVAHEAYPMLRVEGDGVFEIPVGPIHAGIIEPGHFRFSVLGERIVTLEGKLFFTHKGVEKILEGKTPEEAMPFVERISGDMAAAHALAFVTAVENAEAKSPSISASYTRALVLELERITMHIHDIANIGGMGTGFALISSRGFAVKERMMQLSDTLLHNRFWRGLIAPSGVTRTFTETELTRISEVATQAVRDLREVADIALSSEGFRERLETTGVLTKDKAVAYGALGMGARASGIAHDTRVQHASGAYKALHTHIAMRTEGDIMARFMVRLDELTESVRLIEEITKALHSKSSANDKSAVHTTTSGQHMGIGVSESWRGEVLTVVKLTDGRIERIVVRDPSFINWQLFGELAPGNIIPDFPLCNKSLNLSYSGTDM